MEIKDKLKSRRIELSLTLQEVADIVGVSKATIQRYESGDIDNMRRDKIVLLAKALQVTPAFIMGLEEATEIKNNSLTNSLPALTPKDERDIAHDLQRILLNLESDAGLAFYEGEPMSEESKDILRISLENSMRLAKQLAKKKYTPKKYRK